MPTKEEILEMIDDRGFVYVNDFVDNFQIDDYLIIVAKLHDVGISNKQVKIKVYCKECGREMIVSPALYRKQQNFHCEEHIHHHKSGLDSPFYNRIKVNCTNCNKEYDIIPYDYKKTNRFGDSNHFCCQQCYWEYRSKYYVNERHSMYGAHQSEDNKIKQRELALKMIANNIMPQTLTKPHQKINDLLKEHNVDYVNEFTMKYHSIDIYLSQYHLMVEVMGDYWHANPLKYNKDNLTKQQKKSIKQDRSKYTYALKYENVHILYLWESDINKRLDLCWRLIKEYIDNRGILPNYHSFNYHICDNELLLNDIIATPIQDLKYIDEY